MMPTVLILTCGHWYSVGSLQFFLDLMSKDESPTCQQCPGGNPQSKILHAIRPSGTGRVWIEERP